MKNKKTKIILPIISGLMFTPIMHAADPFTPAAPVVVVNSHFIPVQDTLVAGQVNAEVTNYNNWITQVDPYLAKIEDMNFAVTNAVAQVSASTVTQTQSDGDNTLAQVMTLTFPSLANSNSGTVNMSDANSVMQSLVSPTGPDTLSLPKAAIPPINLDGSNASATSDNEAAAFTNYGALFNNVASTNNAANFQNFINLVGGAYSPILDPSQVDLGGFGQTLSGMSSSDAAAQIQSVTSNPVYQSFQANLRSFVAQRSVGLNILNTLAAERTGNPSPLQMEQEEATWRVSKSDKQAAWSTYLTTASPAVLQRETLKVLAEIERQLFQLHLDNEQLMSAEAITVIQNANNQRLLQSAQNLQLKEVFTNQAKSAVNASNAQSLADQKAAADQLASQ